MTQRQRPSKTSVANLATVALPMTVLALALPQLTSNRLYAADALLGEKLSETLRTKRLFILRSELLPSQHLVTLRAHKALSVPGGVLVRNSSFVDHLKSNNHLL